MVESGFDITPESWHDYMEATAPVKNFGKRSRTKYTHLLDQDTTVKTGGFGGSAPVKAGGKSLEGGGCFSCGGPHLKKGMFNYAPACQLVNNISWTPDCPQYVGGPLPPRTGANATPTAPRNWGTNSYTGSWRDGDVYRKGVDRGLDGSDRYRRGDERPRDRSGWNDDGPVRSRS